MRKNKPIFRRDCRFFQGEDRCTAYKDEDMFLVSCGKDCPFFEKLSEDKKK